MHWLLRSCNQPCLACIFRGVEKAQESQSQAPPVQAEASEEAATAGAEETNGPTPEEIAEAEAKVSALYSSTMPHVFKPGAHLILGPAHTYVRPKINSKQTVCPNVTCVCFFITVYGGHARIIKSLLGRTCAYVKLQTPG